MSDLQTLFDADPNEHSRQDIEAIVAKLREMRRGMNTAGIPAKEPKKSGKPADPDLADVKVEL